MNLRTKFIWDILVTVSVVIMLVAGYQLYHIIRETNHFWETYRNETIGTDKELTDRVLALEEKLQQRADYRFKVKEVPTDLTKVIALDGTNLGAYYGMTNVRFSAGITGKEAHAVAHYRDQTFTVTVGDSIAGGVVKDISPETVTFERDGEVVIHHLTPVIK